jgi:hypothetical protein
MDIASLVAALKEQRTRIDHAVAALEALGSPARRGRPSKAASTPVHPRRHMSMAARKRISHAMKLRWAKWKGKSAPKKSAPKKTKTRPAMSAAARKRLSALMKARWAQRKRAEV